jgi:stage II sporulation protein P
MSNNRPKNASRGELPLKLSYGALGIFLAVIGALSVLGINSAQRAIGNSARISRENNGLIKLDTQSCRFLLCNGIPILERTAGEDDPVRLFEFDWAGIYWRLAANLRHTSSREILTTQFPLLGLAKIQPKLLFPKPPLKAEPPPTPRPSLPELPEIMIYHTHTSESYLPISGQEHLLNQHGDIVKVGARLKEVLEKDYHIRTIHCDTIHDQPPFKESYERSQVTVNKYLREYPSLKILIDMHRDATPGINAVCTIKGIKTATVLLVVGSDQMRSHPRWKQNQQFALKIADLMNRYYPGLNSGVIVSKGRYNQHLHPQSLIWEFGDQYSTLEEAFHAVDACAAVLNLILKAE